MTIRVAISLADMKISRLMSDDGQNTNLNDPAFRFFGETFLESCNLRPPVSGFDGFITHGRVWSLLGNILYFHNLIWAFRFVASIWAVGFSVTDP